MSTRKNGWISQLSLILTGQVFSLTGSGIVQFSIIWWLTFTMDSAVVLSLAMIMGVLPVILFSPLAGVIADRYNRKMVMIVADAFIALVTLAFFFLLAAGTPPTSLVYVLLFLRAVGSSFHHPAFEAAMPMITPHSQLVRIAAIVQMLRSGINLLTPMMGALLISIMPLRAILLIDIGTAILAIVLLSMLRSSSLSPRLPNESRSTLRGHLTDLRQGLGYIYRWRGLLILIIVFAVSNFLLAPMLAMMPLIIARHFGGGATEYGFFEMALAVGLIFGSLLLSVWGGNKRKIILVNAAQVLSGLFITSIALVPVEFFFLVLIATALTGMASAFINSPVVAILQACVEKEMLGRVMSIGTTACSLAMPISLIIAGPLAEHVGLLTLIWLPGILSLLLGVCCFFIRDLMHIEEQTPQKKAPLVATSSPVENSQLTD